jgi:chromosome segregation ATPase
LCGELLNIEDIHRTIDSLQRSISDSAAVTNTIAKEITPAIPEQADQKDETIAELNYQLQSLQTEIRRLEEEHQQEISAYKSQAKEHEAELERMKLAFDESQSLVETSSQAIVTSTAHYKQLLAEKDHDIQELHEQLKRISQEMTLQASESQDLQRETENLLESNGYRIREQEVELEQLRSKLVSSQQQLQDVMKECDQLKDISSIQETEKSALQKQVKQLHQQLDQQRDTIQKFEANLFHVDVSNINCNLDDDITEQMQGLNLDDDNMDMEVFSRGMDDLMNLIASKSDSLSMNIHSLRDQSNYIENQASRLKSILAE